MNVWYAAANVNGNPRAGSVLAFQQSFDLAELGRIVEFPEVLGLLSDLFPFNKRIFLVGNDFGSGCVELGY